MPLVSAGKHIHIIGARPNFMKAAPVVQALEARGARPILLHTGQHYDHAMSEVFFEQLGLPRPDQNLGVGSGSHAKQTAALMLALESAFEELRPGLVVVYGDINSTLAATIVASKLGIAVAHVEAGLRSFDRDMPEELNRIVTDALSTLHFVTSPEAMGHLAREGIPAAGMHFVGNPMIDTLLRFRDVLDLAGIRQRLGLPERYGVATLHRPSNVDDPQSAARLVTALASVATSLPIVVPLHPRGREALSDAGLLRVRGVHVVDPLGYLEFMALVAGSSIVLTDSGGVQEETTVLGVPCLTLRENTERPITIEMGTNQLVGSDPDAIIQGAERALSSHTSPKTPPLWDGRAGERIAEVLISYAT